MRRKMSDPKRVSSPNSEGVSLGCRINRRRRALSEALQFVPHLKKLEQEYWEGTGNKFGPGLVQDCGKRGAFRRTIRNKI